MDIIPDDDQQTLAALRGLRRLRLEACGPIHLQHLPLCLDVTLLLAPFVQPFGPHMLASVRAEVSWGLLRWHACVELELCMCMTSAMTRGRGMLSCDAPRLTRTCIWSSRVLWACPGQT